MCPVGSSEEKQRGNAGAKYEEKKPSGFFVFFRMYGSPENASNIKHNKRKIISH